MKTLDLINVIATSPNLEVIVIGDNNYMTPMQAIAFLSTPGTNFNFKIEFANVRKTLYIY